MGQSPISEPPVSVVPAEPAASSLAFLAGAFAERSDGAPCVVVVKTRDAFTRWLNEPAFGVEWLQIEDLMGDPEVWALAAQGSTKIPLDVILSDPAAEFALLYRLVDVRIARSVRVTVPAVPGFLKALRLAASLQIPVRLLPGQPDPELVSELMEAARFYLRDPMVDVPVEFFHSLLAGFCGGEADTLWAFLEEDPAVFVHCDDAGDALLPPDFIDTHFTRLLENDAECVECPWATVCAGYFKWPDPDYSCAGVKQLFASFKSAAEEIDRDLSTGDRGDSSTA